MAKNQFPQEENEPTQAQVDYLNRRLNEVEQRYRNAVQLNHEYLRRSQQLTEICLKYQKNHEQVLKILDDFYTNYLFTNGVSSADGIVTILQRRIATCKPIDKSEFEFLKESSDDLPF